jgi:diamine N-acetyltransferase
VTLREITRDNRASIKALKVLRKQEHYVDSVKESLAEAAATPGARPWYRAVYAGEVPVGFLMVCDDVPPGNPDNALALLPVADAHRPPSLGSRLWPCGPGPSGRVPQDQTRAEILVASVVAGKRTPLGFYLRYGFEPTGQMFEGEQVIQLCVATAPKSE